MKMELDEHIMYTPLCDAFYFFEVKYTQTKSFSLVYTSVFPTGINNSK